MKAIVIGQVEKDGGRTLEMVLNRHCDSLSDIQQSVEEAFDRDADTIILKRIRLTGKAR